MASSCLSVRLVGSLLLAALADPADAAAKQPPGVAAFITRHHLTRYRVALVDLDGDRRPEALVYAEEVTDGSLCGTGGCNLYVVTLTTRGYRRVTAIRIVHLPVRVLRSVSNGWHDLGVVVSGGGILPGYEARLCFDGHRYPTNPTAPPAVALRRLTGRIVIGR